MSAPSNPGREVEGVSGLLPIVLTPGSSPQKLTRAIVQLVQGYSTLRTFHAQPLHLRHLIAARPSVSARARNSRRALGEVDKFGGLGDSNPEWDS